MKAGYSYSKYLLAFTSQLDEAQNNDSFNGRSQELNPAIWFLATSFAWFPLPPFL